VNFVQKRGVGLKSAEGKSEGVSEPQVCIHDFLWRRIPSVVSLSVILNRQMAEKRVLYRL
jgi:hypothetical protein